MRNNQERPKDQVNPTQRVGVIKEIFGDRPAASLESHEIKDWLITLGRAAGKLNRYESTLSAIFSYMISDASIAALTGAGRPLVGEQKRARVVASLAAVDAVVIFPEPTPL